MPQLQKNLWICGPFQIDFDRWKQLRISGPGDHLYLGFYSIPQNKININSVTYRNNKLYVKGVFKVSKATLHRPVMGGVRTVREFAGQCSKKGCFPDMKKSFPNEMMPTKTTYQVKKRFRSIEYGRIYGQECYGTIFQFSKNIKIKKDNNNFLLSSPKGEEIIPFTIIVFGNGRHSYCALSWVLKNDSDLTEHELLKTLFERTGEEIKFLLSSKRTSGFDFGTIFPRDWAESADLGKGDLTPKSIDYMYKQALKHVNKEGLGWHEEVVGEHKFKLMDKNESLVDRSMIDIEPRYILGLRSVSSEFLKSQVNLERMKQVAHFIIREAEAKDLICFRKKDDGTFYSHGNWRDSKKAFKKVSEPIAPFDVNAVFYPEALKTIHNFSKELGIKKDLRPLISKWKKVKNLYKFKNKDGIVGYALALYDIRFDSSGKAEWFKRLKVNHTDEAYDLFYNNPSERDVYSFAKRLVGQKYFYTFYGPALVGKEDGYSTKDYHGRVIWTKQAALCMAGLLKQLEIAKKNKWSGRTKEAVEDAIFSIYHGLIRTFLKLGGVPELHFEKDGEVHFYDEQEGVEGQMSKIQLWSAVGARRIVRDYHRVFK